MKQYCFACGRGTIHGVVGIPCEIILQAISKDFKVLLSKDKVRIFPICKIFIILIQPLAENVRMRFGKIGWWRERTTIGSVWSYWQLFVANFPPAFPLFFFLIFFSFFFVQMKQLWKRFGCQRRKDHTKWRFLCLLVMVDKKLRKALSK